MVRIRVAKSSAEALSLNFSVERLRRLLPCRRGRLVAAIPIAFIAACSRIEDAPTAPKAPTASPSFTFNFVRSDGRPKTQDEIFAEIASHVPGYAGTYYASDGTPITSLVDLSKVSEAEQAIAPLIKNGKNGDGPRKSQFKKVAHDFLKLYEWKSVATRQLFLQEGVAYVDIDEVNNRLDIGIANAAAASGVKRFLKDNAIPLGTITLLPADTSPNYNQNPPNVETLRNTQSLYGGVEIRPQGLPVCSLGFNAMLGARDINGSSRLYSYDHFFVTAMHCMGQIGYPSNTPIYSAIDQNGFIRIIGYEFRQPEWRGQDRYLDCPAGSKCSLADAALVRYSVPWGGARIARTTFVGTYGSDTGSVTLDPFYAPWAVVDSVEDYTLLSGATLYKVGRTTGWTQGSVTQTCQNWRLNINGYPSQYVLLCQWTASSGVKGGDSGGPVFKNKLGYYPQVQVVGNVWGGTTAYMSFSFYPYVAYELTTRDTPTACAGMANPCWPRLAVSMN